MMSAVTHEIAAQDPPEVANLESCQLINAEQIEDCFVAYRVFGELNEARDNAILVPTWFGGKSERWLSYLGPEAYIDTTKFFVIVADAFGNGLSSSPSNSVSQPGIEFPDISIRDMVNSHHRLVVEHLGLSKVHAIVGISMGGMQAFEWSIAYPDFADLIVPVVGSPRLGAYDRYVWEATVRAIDRHRAKENANELIAAEITPLLQLVSSTTRRVDETEPGAVDSILTATEEGLVKTNFDNFAAQANAMLGHDVSRDFDFDMVKAASSVEAKMLVIYSPDDHVVTPFAAEAFANLVGARTLSVPSNCGHGVTECEKQQIGSEIRTFLEGQ